MKFGIFSGTFDPFTVAHYNIVKNVLDCNVVDKVIIIPTIVDYYRKDKSEMFDLSQREEIINTWFKNYSNVILDFSEYDRVVNVRKYYDNPEDIHKRRYCHMLKDLIFKYDYDCSSEFYTIIGTDSWNNLESWYNFKELSKDTKFIVFRRDNEPLKDLAAEYSEFKDQPCQVFELDSNITAISATKIRKHLISDRIGNSFYVYLEEVEDYLKTGKTWFDRFQEETKDAKLKDLLIAHTPIFDLVEGPMVEEGFKPVKIKSPDWVSIIVEKDGKFLMEKQLRHGLNKEFEEFPCGMVEAGEDIIEAGLRELQEETGYVVCDNRCVHYLGKFAANPAFMTNYMHYLHVNLDYTLYDKCQTSFDEHEHLTSYWVNKKTAFDNFIKSEGSAIMGCAWMILMKKQIYDLKK